MKHDLANLGNREGNVCLFAPANHQLVPGASHYRPILDHVDGLAIGMLRQQPDEVAVISISGGESRLFWKTQRRQ